MQSAESDTRALYDGLTMTYLGPMNAQTPLTTAQLDALRPDAQLRAHYLAQGYASTEEEADRQYLLTCCSDLYTEVNGIRPRWIGDYTFEQLAVFYYNTADELKIQQDEAAKDEQTQKTAEQTARTPKQFTIGDSIKL